jgi:SPP1 gp7 family putative phage head morphogenesis protein
VNALLSQVTQDGGRMGLMQLGVADEGITNFVDENAVLYASTRAAELVGMKWVNGKLVDNPRAEWAITDGTRELLRGTITQAVNEGWSNDKLASAIEDGYAFSSSRAEMIARTETAFADVEGNMIAYRESGMVAGKQWILGPEPCEICQANAEQGTIDLEDDFESGDDAPPAHPHCECDVIPVLEEDQ